MEAILLKRIGYWILSIMGLFSALILEWIAQLGLNVNLIIFITGSWLATILLVEEFIRLYFKIPKEVENIEREI